MNHSAKNDTVKNDLVTKKKGSHVSNDEDNVPVRVEEVVTYAVIPPDGGWGWVIVTAAFLCNLVVDGIIFTFGVFLPYIQFAFNESKSTVSIVGSLLPGFYLIVGPFVSALANKHGFRTVTILGSIIGCIAFTISLFATDIVFLCISYGIIGGIGFGLVYVPAVITAGFYFEKWRAIATGIAVCGSGIGTFVMAPVAEFLIEEYGWRGALLIQAGFVLNCAVFGSLFRPLKPTRVITTREITEPTKTSSEQIPMLLRIKMDRDSSLQKCTSQSSFDEEKPSNGFVNSNDKIHHLNLSEVSVSADNLHGHRGVSKAKPKTTHSANRLSAPILDEFDVLEPVPEEQKGGITDNTRVAVPYQKRGQRIRTTSEGSSRSRRSSIAKEEGSKPMNRDDAFFTGSLNRLPQYTSQNSLAYHVSVTRLPTEQDGRHKRSAMSSMCKTISTLLDFSLLRSPTFLLLALSSFLTMMGFFVPFMFLADRAAESGMELSLATFLLSSIGVTNTVGRVVCGMISNIPGINALVINNVALSIGGIATMASGISMSSAYQFIYSGIFGVAIGCFASLRPIIIVDLMGLDSLTNAFGLLLLFQGLSAVIGSPIAGAFRDATGSYDSSFYLSGGLILISAILCYPLNWLNAWEKKKASGKKPFPT